MQLLLESYHLTKCSIQCKLNESAGHSPPQLLAGTHPYLYLMKQMILRPLHPRFSSVYLYEAEGRLQTNYSSTTPCHTLLYTKHIGLSPSKNTAFLDASYMPYITCHILPFIPIFHSFNQEPSCHTVLYTFCTPAYVGLSSLNLPCTISLCSFYSF